VASRHQPIDLTTRPTPHGSARFFPRVTWPPHFRRFNTSVIRGGFTLLAALCDLAAIGLSVAAIHFLSRDSSDITGDAHTHLSLTLIVTIFFIASNVMRNEYEFMRYLVYKERIQRVFLPWNVVFLCAYAMAFCMRIGIGFSIYEALAFYGSGLFSLIIARILLVAFIRARAEAGTIAARRVLLIGFEEEIAKFSERYEPWRLGMRIAAASVLRGEENLKEDLALASAYARILRPDDIFILLPWSHKETIDECINTFLRIPAAIHLGPEQVLDRFADAQIFKVGPVASLNLVHRPLSATEVCIKRAVDIVLSATALFLLSPLLLTVAIIIKCDSPGPIIFRQRRYGFNQEPFRIYKFRSMTTLEDGADIQQAAINDVRITRIGRLMRRLNIDELPQLLNVLRGEMSLVGPRPHAVAHDQLFERSIGLYARRHNAKPGITGWAQVNGLRGAVTDEKIRQRIAYDLYYIDNWSLLFDIQILWLTVVSKKAYRNAV
jgi:putative colanic acid biosynthesis UDP-glucose lipid carrier transferase